MLTHTYIKTHTGLLKTHTYKCLDYSKHIHIHAQIYTYIDISCVCVCVYVCVCVWERERERVCVPGWRVWTHLYACMYYVCVCVCACVRVCVCACVCVYVCICVKISKCITFIETCVHFFTPLRNAKSAKGSDGWRQRRTSADDSSRNTQILQEVNGPLASDSQMYIDCWISAQYHVLKRPANGPFSGRGEVQQTVYACEQWSWQCSKFYESRRGAMSMGRNYIEIRGRWYILNARRS